MPIVSLLPSIFVAYHDRSGGGTSGAVVLFVFLGVVATAGWLIFSELRWRTTVAVTVAGWAALITLLFVF